MRARISGARYHIALNSEFEKYQWTDLPGQMDSWARSFLYRIDDISSFGNIMSTQNRFVQQNYVEKINKLRKYQRVKAPSHVTAKGTQNGALVTWRNEEPGADIFVVCRDGKEIASVPVSANQYVDTFNGKASYTVYVIDTDGNRSLASIPSYCLAGDADDEAPIIINPSPVTSVPQGHDVNIKLSMVDNRSIEDLSAVLHYRTIGCKEWKQIPFKHRIRAAFAITIPAEEFSIQGMEYYITASDSRNVAMYPADAPARLHTIIVTGSGSNKLPSPVIRLTAGNRLKWEKNPDVDMYRIYRSKSSDFATDASSFITFVGGQTTSFYDNGIDLDGTPLKGTYFYRVTAVGSDDMESNASEILKIDYK